jgi:hypothetical protein
MRNAILIATAFIIATATLTSAQAVNLSLEDGGTKLVVSGEIVRGDLKRFRAVASVMPDGSVVGLQSKGGLVLTAIEIGRIVQKRGFWTLVGRKASCESACTIIWFSGRHALIQRNSRLGLHAPAIKVHGKFHLKGYNVWASYLRKLGLSPEQILYALGTPQPLTRFATEEHAKKLGIKLQEVTLQNWKTCIEKYCLVVP